MGYSLESVYQSEGGCISVLKVIMLSTVVALSLVTGIDATPTHDPVCTGNAPIEKLSQEDSIDNNSDSNGQNFGTQAEKLGSRNKENLSLIHASSVHRMEDDKGFPIDGSGVKVAIIDSGINPRDLYLKSKVTDCYNFIRCTDDISDDNGHGTIVTRIILEVAPKATILSYKVLNQDLNGNERDIIEALDRALKNGASIINLSFGDSKILTYDPENRLTKEIEKAINQGVVVVLAAGNKGARWGVFSPGTSPSPITVGATTDDCTQVAEYSNRGPVLPTWEIKPDVVAPGTYEYGSIIYRGTSFAAPYVSGALALIKQKHPSWAPHRAKSALATTATILTNDNKIISPVAQGSGLINVYNAINTRGFISPIHISCDPIEIENGENEQVKLLNIDHMCNIDDEYLVKWKWDHEHKGLRGDVEPYYEARQIKLSLLTEPSAMCGCYSGNILITSRKESWHVPILVLVSAEGEISHPFE